MKVGTTKIRRGLLVLSVCARISHRKLLGGMSRSRPPLRRPQTWSKMPRRPPSLLLVCASAPGPLQIVDEQLQENKQAPAKPRKQTCSANTPWQDLAVARRARARDRAENAVVRADQAVTGLGDVVAALRRQWLQERSTNETKADEVKQELNDANKELAEAKKELAEAKKELDEAEQKYEEAEASVQAGRGQAGGLLRVQLLLLTLVCSTPACVFVRSTVVAFWGHALLSARVISSLNFTVLACSTSGSGRGSWLL